MSRNPKRPSAASAVADVLSGRANAPKAFEDAILADRNKSPAKEIVTITKANIKVTEVPICGTRWPYVQNRFSAKASAEMQQAQSAGSTNKKGKKRSAKDFERLYNESMYLGIDGKRGIPAMAFRAAAISACRLVGFKMTLSKLAFFVIADTMDEDGVTPLVHITGKPKQIISPVRLPNGSFDQHARAMWAPGWTAKVMIQFDADIFTLTDIYNLMDRVGGQVGIGEGRNDSRNSVGCGWGGFELLQ